MYAKSKSALSAIKLYKIAVCLTVGLLVLGLLSGCAANREAAVSNTKTGKVIYHLGGVIQPEQAANFNPFLPSGNWPTAFDYLYNRLLYFNPVKGELMPDLAAVVGT